MPQLICFLVLVAWCCARFAKRVEYVLPTAFAAQMLLLSLLAMLQKLFWVDAVLPVLVGCALIDAFFRILKGEITFRIVGQRLVRYFLTPGFACSRWLLTDAAARR